MVFGRLLLLSYLSFPVYVNLTSLFPWEAVEADTFWNRDSLFYGDYSALLQGVELGLPYSYIVNTWSTVGRSGVPFNDFRSEIKRESQCFFTWLWTWVLLVAMFSDMCSSKAGAGVERKEWFTNSEGGGELTEGERELPGFPTALRFLAPVYFCISALGFCETPSSFVTNFPLMVWVRF